MKLKEQPKLKKCKNVGKLIEELQKLPKSLPIRQGFGEGISIEVYNISTDAFLEFEEI